MKSWFLKVAILVVASLLFLSVGLPQLSNLITQHNPVNIDLTHIPIGDGRISSQPQVGTVWSCRTHFGQDGIGGAQASGGWIHPDGTYDLTAKPTVKGSIRWHSKLSIQLAQDLRKIVGNRLPEDPTGKFPISPDDAAYQYDRNPNSIKSVTYSINLPALPQIAKVSSCLPLGEIGVLVNGGYFFNALDANGKDAVAHEIQDLCQGHPEINGTYHYHNVTSCIENRKQDKGHSALIGYALDGFGIYGHQGKNGQTLTNADLDACHGHQHEIEWDGTLMNLYHYHATWEYPYTVGCYRGTPTELTLKPTI